jgi:DNA-binding transcriptional LysR family regulator
VAVVDEHGFTAAARACLVSQPALSHAVAQLERELGARLFDRSGRQVRLTPAGEAFVAHARDALRSGEAAREAVDEVSGLRRGHLDVVSQPLLAAWPTAVLLGHFRRLHPGIALRLARPAEGEEVAAAVAGARYEVGVAELPLHAGRGLDVVLLGRQELVAVLPDRAGWPAGPVLTLAELAAAPLVTTPRGSPLRHLLDTALARVGATPEVAAEAEERDALVPLVVAGAGWAVVPRGLAAGREVRVAELDPPLHRTVGLVSRPGRRTPAAQALIALARSEAPLRQG